MNDDEKGNFGNLLTGISELYSKKMSEQLLEIYWQTLKKYSYEEILQSVNFHVLNPDVGQFMPKPADIVRYLDGGTSENALRAWTKVLVAMSHVGSYQSISFNDPIIHLVIHEMGGWIELCQIREDRMPFIAQEFQKRYAQHYVHKPQNYPKYLPGIFEHQNSIHGHQIPEPVLFDEKKIALLNTTFYLTEKTDDQSE